MPERSKEMALSSPFEDDLLQNFQRFLPCQMAIAARRRPRTPKIMLEIRSLAEAVEGEGGGKVEDGVGAVSNKV